MQDRRLHLLARAGPLLSTPARRATAEAMAASGAIQASLLVSGVIAARALGVEGRGELAFMILVPTVLVIIGSTGLPIAVPYFVARQPSVAAAVVRSLLAVGVVQAFVLAAIGGVIVWARLDVESRDLAIPALVTLLSIPAKLLHLYGLGVLQGLQRFRSFNLLRLVPTASYALSLVALFAAGLTTLPAVASAWTASSFLAAAGTWSVALKVPESKGPAAPPPLRRMLSFGVRGVLGWASPVGALRVDQAVIGFFLTPAALGLYVVAQAFTNLPRFLSVSIGMVAYPRLAASEGHGEARHAFGRYAWFNVAVSAAVIGALAILAQWLIPLFFGQAFTGALATTRILLLATFFWSVRRVLADGARGLGFPGLGTVAEVTSWGALLPGLAVLTPAWGMEGVAAALAASGALSLSVLAGALARKGITPLVPWLSRPRHQCIPVRSVEGDLARGSGGR